MSSVVRYVKTKVAPSELTGGAGTDYEHEIQGLFAVLMVCDGELAAFPNLKISGLEFQTHAKGYCLDDILVSFSEDGRISNRLLCQAKRTIKLTRSCRDFTDTVQAAWLDFHNKEIVNPASDAFAIVTGPMSAKDNKLLGRLFDQARRQPADSFIKRMSCGAGLSARQISLYGLIKECVEAQEGERVADEELYEFLKRFYILQPDTWYECGMVESYALSLLKAKFPDLPPRSVWNAILRSMSKWNSAAGVMNRDALIKEIKSACGIRNAEDVSKSVVKVESQVVALQSASAGEAKVRRDRLALLALAGMWQDDNEVDREFLKTVVGVEDKGLCDLEQELAQLNPPLMTISGGFARIVNRRGLWRVAAGVLQGQEVDKFLSSAVQLLRKTDERFELDPEKRLSYFENRTAKASKLLREGVAQGLALLGAENKFCTCIALPKRENCVTLSVRKIFEKSDWKVWATLDDLLSLLAEAAPEEYLSCAQRFLKKKTGGLEALYEQECPGVIFNPTYVTGFVRALGLLAWMPDCFSASLDLLAQLVARDPGGNYRPRAADVLQEILHPLGPHTVVPWRKRVKVFSSLVRLKYKDVLWDVVTSLLPTSHYAFVVQQSWPIYRDVGWHGKVGENLDMTEVSEQFDAYALLANELCAYNVERILKILNVAASHWRNEPFLALAKTLKRIVCRISQDDQYRLWKELREILRFARMTRKREKVQSPGPREQAIAELVALYELAVPQYKHRFLFSYTERHYGRTESGLSENEYAKDLEDRQRAAVREVLSSCGVSGTFDFASQTDHCHYVGYLLGQEADVDGEVVPVQFELKDEKRRTAVVGYVNGRFSVGGWSWVDKVINGGWSVEDKVTLLVMLPFCADVWHRAAGILKNDVGMYWHRANAFWVNRKEEVDEAVDGLLGVGRCYAAIQILAHGTVEKTGWRMDLCCRVLKAIVAHKAKDEFIPDTRYYLKQMLEAVQESENVSEEEKANFEWYFFDAFEMRAPDGFRPVALNHALASDPKMFCEALKIAFLPAKKAAAIKEERVKKPLSEIEQKHIERVWKLLYDWAGVPGVDEHGVFHGRKFNAWVRYVFREARKMDRLTPAKRTLARAMIHAPMAADGFWLPHEIAKLMEKPSNETMLNAYDVAWFNSRGVHWVDKEMKEDKKLHAKYMKMAEEAEEYGYVGLAKTMRSLASSILDMARRENEDNKRLDEYFKAKQDDREE